MFFAKHVPPRKTKNVFPMTFVLLYSLNKLQVGLKLLGGLVLKFDQNKPSPLLPFLC